MFDTSYLNALPDHIRFVEKNHAWLQAAAANGDLLAGCILDRREGFRQGDYRKSQVVAFNAEVEAWAAEHA